MVEQEHLHAAPASHPSHHKQYIHLSPTGKTKLKTTVLFDTCLTSSFVSTNWVIVLEKNIEVTTNQSIYMIIEVILL